ncbi:MAG: branched-chain amino acid ABC transporter permease [Burkholderiaceae bacterium]
MNADIALILAQDGVVNGAIYALVALALVLVYAVTRVIFIPQGELVSFGALTLASLQMGQVPPTAWLLAVMALTVLAVEGWQAWRTRSAALARRTAFWNLLVPAFIVGLVYLLAPLKPNYFVQLGLVIALVLPLGPMIYRLAYQPIADASVLVLLIVSVAVHLALVGLGLIFFGPEGVRTTPFIEGRVSLGVMDISGQGLWVVTASLLIIVGLYLYFGRTIFGKALRATAINRKGARIVGIKTTYAGSIAFLLAALLAVVSGALISPITTMYYDTGFLVGLKAFVGAIIGGLASYPIAAGGALLVGLIESYSSFWASAFKEVIVFTLIIPVLLWRSLTSQAIEEEED